MSASSISVSQNELDDKIQHHLNLLQEQHQIIQSETDKLHTIQAILNDLMRQKKHYLGMSETERHLMAEVLALREQLAMKDMKVMPVLEEEYEEEEEEEEEEEKFDWRLEMINIKRCMTTTDETRPRPSIELIDNIIEDLLKQIEEIEKEENIVNLYYISFHHSTNTNSGVTDPIDSFIKINLITSKHLYDLQYKRQGKKTDTHNWLSIDSAKNFKVLYFTGFDTHSYISLHGVHSPKTSLEYGETYSLIPIQPIKITNHKIIKKYIESTKGCLVDIDWSNGNQMRYPIWLSMIKRHFDALLFMCK